MMLAPLAAIYAYAKIEAMYASQIRVFRQFFMANLTILDLNYFFLLLLWILDTFRNYGQIFLQL